MNESTLKRALLANAAFSTISGIVFIVYGSPVADLIGIGAPLLYQIIGAGLLGFAGYTAWTATRAEIKAFDAALISLGDFSWVIGTVIVIALAYSSLNGLGIVAMLAVASVVLAFGTFQLIGIGRKYAVADMESTHRMCVLVETPTPANKMWDVIADMENINAYSPHLTEAILRDNAAPAVNAVRQCTDDKGKTWAEQCTRYDQDERKLEVHFLANEPGFPYPFKTMDGGWEVTPNDHGSTVTVWFEVTPKYRLFHPLILAVMSKDLASNFAQVVARMSAAARGEPISQDKPSMNRISYKLAPC